VSQTNLLWKPIAAVAFMSSYALIPRLSSSQEATVFRGTLRQASDLTFLTDAPQKAPF
jgi:hypothetical protein